MQVGCKIKIPCSWGGYEPETFIVEEFRYCLGIFRDEDHRKAGKFTPLCDLFERGPESEEGYISNFGPYITNQVQAWIDVP
jgi:hypothetical protein